MSARDDSARTAAQTRSELVGAQTSQTQLSGGLLPGEGDFQVILIDALGGNDVVTVGPTVQKTVWVDAGSGDDRVEIRSGNAILIDQTEQRKRNDTKETAYA